MRMLACMALLVAVIAGCTDDFSSSNGSLLDSPSDSKPIGMSAPHLAISVGIESGAGWLHWSSVSGATTYFMEYDYTPGFSAPSELYVGGDLHYDLGLSSEYPLTRYYRVCAQNIGAMSDWSNIVQFP